MNFVPDENVSDGEKASSSRFQPTLDEAFFIGLLKVGKFLFVLNSKITTWR